MSMAAIYRARGEIHNGCTSIPVFVCVFRISAVLRRYTAEARKTQSIRLGEFRLATRARDLVT